MQTTCYGLQFYYDEEVEYPPGEVLLREGETQTRIYVLRRGSVEIVKGGEVVAVVEKRGELFGEISALLGIECTTTVRTREKSTLFMIEDAEEFLENGESSADDDVPRQDAGGPADGCDEYPGAFAAGVEAGVGGA